MNLNVYEKTRYQNIYRHKKNKNYVIMMSKPVKTSIATIDGKKIIKIEDAINIRDNPKIKKQKGIEVTNKEDFDTLWNRYIEHCKYVKKLAYNTINQKVKIYNSFFKNKIKTKVSKITTNEIVKFIDNLDTTNKQKNVAIKHLRAFFNWCIEEELLLISPMTKIKKYKVDKEEMKFWIPEEIPKFLNAIDNDIENKEDARVAYRTKLFTLITLSLGNRVGETRALTYDNFIEKLEIVEIKHSINYDTKSNDFLSSTKNYQSRRDIDITEKLINEVNNYFIYMQSYYNVKKSDLIFFNYTTNRPFSDVTLRKSFYYYCDKANVTKIRMYDLRHTYVATMMGEGLQLYHFSKRIGHKRESTTANKYGHLSTEVKKQVAKVIDKYL